MIVELSKEIKVVRPEGKAVFPYSNSLYIDDDVKTMIDAGAGRAYNELPIEQVRTLILSHYHFDHLHAWSLFKNAAIMAGAEERWAYEEEEKHLLSSGYQHWEELMGEMKTENWASRLEMPEDVLAKPGFQSFQPDAYYRDGQRFETGHTNFIAIHTPGHSPGHYAFYFPQEKILFSGDLDISPRGPWYGGEYSDFEELQQSVKRLMELKPEILVTSHRRVFYDNIEKHFTEYLDVALEKERKILKYLGIPRLLDEIAVQEFVRERDNPSRHEQFWTKIMILKHLGGLQLKQQVESLPDGRYVKC